MKKISNVLWTILSGWWLALSYYITGILYCIFIVFIPFGLQYFKFGKLIFAPFGKDVKLNFNKHIIANILMLIFGGLYTAIGLCFVGLLWCVTVVGIPIGLQCFKLAKLVLWPFGSEIIHLDSGNDINNIDSLNSNYDSCSVDLLAESSSNTLDYLADATFDKIDASNFASTNFEVNDSHENNLSNSSEEVIANNVDEIKLNSEYVSLLDRAKFLKYFLRFFPKKREQMFILRCKNVVMMNLR